MDIQNFWVFALAGLMLNLTPGNDMIYVATCSASQGVKAGAVARARNRIGINSPRN